MSQLQLFARLAKVDEAKRQVTGIIASETPDAANEVFDYDTSKGNFEAWSANVAKASGGKSVGNLRAMHGSVVAGTLDEIVFDDVAKTISVVANVVDDNEWNKVLKGAYTGFSIGGKYLKKWADTVNKSLKRYTAQPTEVSLVDVGCNFDATFTLCKADGMETEVRYEDTQHGILAKMADPETDPAELPELSAKLAKAFGHTIADPDPVNQDDEELAKGAYSIGDLARLAESVSCFCRFDSVSYNMDGTTSMKSFGPEIKAAALLLYDGLLKLVAEDVEAAKAKLKEMKKQLDDEEGEPLRKALGDADSLVSTVDSMVKALGFESGQVSEAMEKINTLLTGTEELTKSLTTVNEELASTKAELEKVKGEPAPAKGVKALVVGKEEDGLTKSADSGAGNAEEDSKDPLVLMKRAQARPISIGVNPRFNQNGG